MAWQDSLWSTTGPRRALQGSPTSGRWWWRSRFCAESVSEKTSWWNNQDIYTLLLKSADFTAEPLLVIPRWYQLRRGAAGPSSFTPTFPPRSWLHSDVTWRPLCHFSSFPHVPNSPETDFDVFEGKSVFSCSRHPYLRSRTKLCHQKKRNVIVQIWPSSSRKFLMRQMKTRNHLEICLNKLWFWLIRHNKWFQLH